MVVNSQVPRLMRPCRGFSLNLNIRSTMCHFNLGLVDDFGKGLHPNHFLGFLASPQTGGEIQRQKDGHSSFL